MAVIVRFRVFICGSNECHLQSVSDNVSIFDPLTPHSTLNWRHKTNCQIVRFCHFFYIDLRSIDMCRNVHSEMFIQFDGMHIKRYSIYYNRVHCFHASIRINHVQEQMNKFTRKTDHSMNSPHFLFFFLFPCFVVIRS